jgi:hypothetical protein
MAAFGEEIEKVAANVGALHDVGKPFGEVGAI